MLDLVLSALELSMEYGLQPILQLAHREEQFYAFHVAHMAQGFHMAQVAQVALSAFGSVPVWRALLMCHAIICVQLVLCQCLPLHGSFQLWS